MNKRTMIVLASILYVFFMAESGVAQESYKKFTLKLSGGYGSVSSGDLAAVTDGLNEQMADIARLAGASVTDEIENAKWGPEFEGELVYNFTERWGIGLSLGYIRKSIESMAELQVGTYARVSFEWEPIYKAIPITLNGYFNLPIASKVSTYFKAGIGYYFATWDYTVRTENELVGITVWEEEEGTAKDSGFGLQGGFGFEFNVSDSVAFFVEGTGRYVNLKDWDVDNTHTDALGSETETGYLWYVEKYEGDTDNYYSTLELSDEEPSDPNYRNVRKLEVSFSGVIFKVGVKISF
jgi:opacity protein-like surface antigen